MDCKNYEELIPGFVQGELSGKELEMIKKHLSACSQCQEIVEKTRTLLDIMDDVDEAEPSARLRVGFMERLEQEKASLGSSSNLFRISKLNVYRVAASAALLVVGFAFGKMNSPGIPDTTELAGLRDEVSEMKELVMMSMLKEVSASERIQAVNYVNQFERPSDDVINTLFKTLNEDDSPNVRMAALEGLKKFTSNEQVRLRLIESFEFQNDPILQIMLINLMVELEEKGAAKKFQHLIDSEGTQKIVKDQAEIGIQLLI